MRSRNTIILPVIITVGCPRLSKEGTPKIICSGKLPPSPSRRLKDSLRLAGNRACLDVCYPGQETTKLINDEPCPNGCAPLVRRVSEVLSMLGFTCLDVCPEGLQIHEGNTEVKAPDE